MAVLEPGMDAVTAPFNQDQLDLLWESMVADDLDEAVIAAIVDNQRQASSAKLDCELSQSEWYAVVYERLLCELIAGLCGPVANAHRAKRALRCTRAAIAAGMVTPNILATFAQVQQILA